MGIGDSYFKFYKTNTINSTNEIINPEKYITLSKSVYLKITNANNCSNVLEIKLNQSKLPPTDEPDSSEFINTFTPNNDGFNDVWSFDKLKNYKNLQINIFDKFGNKVFHYKEENPYYWDGKDMQRRKLPTGTYWAILKGENTDENKILNKSMWIYLKNR